MTDVVAPPPVGHERLFHIIDAAGWQAAKGRGELAPASLTDEGFVHLSYQRQVAAVANNLYRDREGLIVLELEQTRLAAPVVLEDSYASGEEFPHVYAAIPLTAVVAEHDLPRGVGGHYTFTG